MDERNIENFKEKLNEFWEIDYFEIRNILNDELLFAVKNNLEKYVKFIIIQMISCGNFIPDNLKQIINSAIQNGNIKIINEIRRFVVELEHKWVKDKSIISDYTRDYASLSNWKKIKKSFDNHKKRKDYELAGRIIHNYINQGPETNKEIHKTIGKFIFGARKYSNKKSLKLLKY